MKKQYKSPDVKKVEFDYVENVLASGTIEIPTNNTNCAYSGCNKDQSTQTQPKRYGWFGQCWW